jgi:hypothetical protein
MGSSKDKIAVYTSVIGDRDSVRDDQVWGDCPWYAFVDQRCKGGEWNDMPAYDRFASPRRNSRAPKLLAHQFLDCDYSIWLDANVALKVPPEQIVSEFLAGHDIAVFKHPERDCLYEEAKTCAVHRLDDPEAIIEQAKKYEDAGFGKKRGLGECNVIVRRHTPRVARFNESWWAEWCRGCVRDQISFPFALDQAGLSCNFVAPSARAGHPYFDWRPHASGAKGQAE